jgi:tetratricopeptide (TPR) repeat protein
VTYSELATRADADVIDPGLVEDARQLAQAEPSLRTAVLYAVVLLRAGRLDEAAGELDRARKTHGDAPAVLLNLAKVKHRKGDTAEALKLARAAVDKAPNDEVALGFWSSLMRLAGKDVELAAALEKLPGFRARLVLGAWHIERGDSAAAEQAYASALDDSRDARPCVELIARDLRAFGQHALLVRLLASRYRLEHHGPFVGLLLVAAHAEEGDLARADALLDAVRGEVPPEDHRFVTELEATLARKRLLVEPPSDTALHGVPLVGPVWAQPLAVAGLSLPEGASSRLIAFAQLADCTQDRAVAVEDPSLEAANDVERACRAIPLLLAEGLTLATNATGMALIATRGSTGLVTFRAPLSAADALQLAFAHPLPKLLVTGVLSRSITSELELELTLHDLAGGAPASFSVKKGGLAELAARAEERLEAELHARKFLAEQPPAFSRPKAADDLLEVTHEVLRLVLAAAGRLDRRRVWGVARVLARADQLVQAHPRADTPALLLAAAYLAGLPQTKPFQKAVRDRLSAFGWAKTLNVA